MVNYTVLVTGGNGFLGQHIVKLLHEKADFVTHIRVLDIRKYERQLDFSEKKLVETFTGDLTDEAVLEAAVRGVDCVVHVASVVDVRNFPDDRNLHKVNVTGTAELLKICSRENVQSFVYCSSQDVIMGYNDVIGCSETLEPPPEFLFGSYAVTKHLAEQIVKKHDGITLPNGSKMRTLSLRPVTMYGDLDFHFVPVMLKTTHMFGGTLIPFAKSDAFSQMAYVGNVAWGFVCAVSSLHDNPNLGGEAFFMCDDTPLKNLFQSCKPYLESQGMKLASFTIPFWLIYTLVTIWTFLIWVISPVFPINTSFTFASVRFINLKVSSVYTKATDMLGYKPLYSYDESLKRSLRYYRQKSLLSKPLRKG